MSLPMARKLQTVLNLRYNEKIALNTTQFYSEQSNRMITLYVVKKAVWDEEKHKNKNITLYSTASTLRIVFFLRDYLYRLQGKPIPTDNKDWNKHKQKIEIYKEWGEVK